MAAPSLDEPTAGFRLAIVTPLEYALTQSGVLLHYLRLAVWPHPLIIDYAWHVARTVSAVLPQVLVVLSLLLATVWAVCRRSGVGFLGAWFFLRLVPIASVMPMAVLSLWGNPAVEPPA